MSSFARIIPSSTWEIFTCDALYKLVWALETEGATARPLLSDIAVYTGKMDTDPVVGGKVLERKESVEGFPLKMPDSGVIPRTRPVFRTTYTIRFKMDDTTGVLSGHGLDTRNVWQPED
ncbi:unnamed protein product [Cyclocybe aegerita]|uniref:Uncharacterized protein n=1 Tax=Cyclocybe aegerita TaxID=1973307 RepID=A0A8S0XPY0_CYCAE|nr:unnamed protein product [Cyclocybe aegerita]